MFFIIYLKRNDKQNKLEKISASKRLVLKELSNAVHVALFSAILASIIGFAGGVMDSRSE